MYQVCLEQRGAEDGGWGYGEKDIGWKDTMPISTSLMPLIDRNSSMALEDADYQIDPHLGIPVSQLSTLAELSSRQQQSVRHRLQARWQCSYPNSSSPSPSDTPASPRNIVTSVLIAMPTSHPHSCPGQFCAGAAASDGATRFFYCQEVPEVSFGVNEAPWTCNQQG
ncbi:hypothetical protein FRC04_000950 [Tulasnella sp. 424]|nr:hypothetical protein FRC04_000950 [Tulasnella sp. 424]